MTAQNKDAALAQWRQQLVHDYPQLEPEERYDKALKAADALHETGLISAREWRNLVKVANAYLFH